MTLLRAREIVTETRFTVRVATVAVAMGISKEAVRKNCRSGAIPAKRRGFREWMIDSVWFASFTSSGGSS